MNIFLDSNIQFEDYFFENKSSASILEYAKEGLINLYISEIVRLELRRQFQKEIESKNRDLNKILKDSKRLKINSEIKLICLNKQLEKFDGFYSELEDNYENIAILEVKNIFLPDIVDRAIYRKKPFTENKSELKDAIIWKTYSNYVEEYNKADCILLTNNVSDFCSKKDKSKIHPELEKDTNKFKVINTSFSFIKEYSSKIESPEHQFSMYISKLEIDENFTLKLIKGNFISEVEDKIDEKLEDTNPFDIKDIGYWNDGYITGFGKELLTCEDIEYDISGNTALISGKLKVSCETESYEYNSSKERGEDSFIFFNEDSLVFELYFNFDMSEGEICDELEITDIDIIDE